MEETMKIQLAYLQAAHAFLHKNIQEALDLREF